MVTFTSLIIASDNPSSEIEMNQDDTPKWLKEYQEIFPDKSPMQKQIDELKAKVAELEKHSSGRRNSSF